jgi:hypothetical protein
MTLLGQQRRQTECHVAADESAHGSFEDFPCGWVNWQKNQGTVLLTEQTHKKRMSVRESFSKV